MAEEISKNEFFNTEYLKADLKRRSAKGGAVTIGTQAVMFFLRMGSTMVLARLLSPQDFGLIAMVAAVINFAILFKDMGLSLATVQRQNINHAQISTLFWINVGLSLIIMLLTAVFAPAIAWFYSEPRLILIVLVLASAFIFGGLTVQHQALLQRQMRFGTLSSIRIISMLAGITAAIVSAWYGAGYWALVLMQITGDIVVAIGVWLTCSWRPGLPSRRSGARKMIAFGGNLTGSHVLNFFARNLDNILIGWRWGPESLGLYSKAYGLLMLPIRQINAPISTVAIPVLSHLQDDPERYRNYYLKAISIISLITMPAVMFMIVMSRKLILIVLGSQWEQASPIFAVLAISAIMQPISNTTSWLLISQGRSRDMFRWGLIGGTITVFAIIVGLPWGGLGVATSYTTFGLLAVPLLFWFVGRTGPIRAMDIYKAIIVPLCIASCTLVTLLLFDKLTTLQNAFWEVICGFGLTLATVRIALFVVPSGQSLLRGVIELGFLLLGKNGR